MSTDTHEKNLEEIVDAALGKHGTGTDAFVPILLEINHAYGYIPAEAIRLVNRKLRRPGQPTPVSISRLYGLASFYSMLSTEKTGRHVVQFCESAPCHVQGGRELIKALQDQLGLEPGQTDPENRFTLKTVSCLGICGMGPVILVDDDYYGSVTPDQLADILAGYK
jgi:NADH-quinone oxidoreductase subunit E